MTTHLVIPDCQVKPDVPTEHLEWIGRYIIETQPDVIVCISDFADMPSLSGWDKGKKSFEGRRYKADVESVIQASERLWKPLFDYNARQARFKEKQYRPRRVMCLGNHENRINRAVEDNAVLDGMLSVDDLQYKKFGWEVHPFLEVATIDGIDYSHYFTSGAMGRPASSAAVVLRERCRSAVMGHVQHTDIAIHKKHGYVALFCGTAYLHDEDYLGPQGNSQLRQIWQFNDVRDGKFDMQQISLETLRKRYA